MNDQSIKSIVACAPPSSSLHGDSILIVEDNPIIALDMAFAVEDAGGTVVGPAASIKEALALIRKCPIAGAILDVNLVDGDITPVAERLIADAVPLIFQTGVGLPADLAARFPDLVVRIKPCIASEMIEHLAAMIETRRKSQ